jgi:acyl-CoA synthetase (AMP-forming)/AMP-acid ligase II
MPIFLLLNSVLDRGMIFTAVICCLGVRTELFSFQIYVNGPTVASGYLHLPELDAKRFVTSPEHGRLYRSGDWGYKHSDGTIEICGRCEPMVKIQGYSIETQVHLFTEGLSLQSFVPLVCIITLPRIAG